MKRVVITGMGCVSPNGVGNEAFCRAILAGKSGVKRITRFDPSELPVQIAGEITGFDELAWVEAVVEPEGAERPLRDHHPPWLAALCGRALSTPLSSAVEWQLSTI